MRQMLRCKLILPYNVICHINHQPQMMFQVSRLRNGHPCVGLRRCISTGITYMFPAENEMREKVRPHSRKKGSGEKYGAAKPKYWMVNMHKLLMESVVLPPVQQGYVQYNLKSLQTVSTTGLMSQARNIQRVDKETINIIAALWQRMDSMTMEEIITTADIFFMNGISAPWYSSALISYVSEMFEMLPMTPQQLSRLCLHIANHGHSPPYLLLALEQRLSETLEEFNMNQVCVCCHLFFLCKNRIRSSVLLNKITDKLLQEFDSVHLWYLPMLMKTLRQSHYSKVSFYKSFGDQIINSNSFRGFRNIGQIMHFAFTYASVRVTHPRLFDYILEHCKKHHFKFRVKDVAKILWACGTLVTDSAENLKDIQTLLLQTNISMQDAFEYPDNLSELLMGLSFLNIYPRDLLNMLFDPRVVKILSGFRSDREKFMQLEFLDCSISIECPSYSGNRLSQSDREFVKSHLTDYRVEIDTQLRKGLEPVFLALQDAFGDECVTCSCVLPHFKTSDILLIYDRKEHKFVPVSEGKEEVYEHQQEKNRFQRIVIMLLSRAQTTFDGKLLGLLHCKLRQMRTLGYEVITVEAEEALQYTCTDLKSTQAAVLTHISKVINPDVPAPLATHEGV